MRLTRPLIDLARRTVRALRLAPSTLSFAIANGSSIDVRLRRRPRVADATDREPAVLDRFTSSNAFRVRDGEAFQRWFKRYCNGDRLELVVFDIPDNEFHKAALVTFFGQEPDSYAWPHHNGPSNASAHPGEALLVPFAEQIRSHLVPGDRFYLISEGHERHASQTHYVVYQEIEISHERARLSRLSRDDPRRFVPLLDNGPCELPLRTDATHLFAAEETAPPTHDWPSRATTGTQLTAAHPQGEQP